MTALEFLKSIPHVPMDMLGEKPVVASNSCRRRWLENKSILLNGAKPGPQDKIQFPVWQLIFFPKGRRCTMQDI